MKKGGYDATAVEATVISIRGSVTTIKAKDGRTLKFRQGTLSGVRFDLRHVGRTGWVRRFENSNYQFDYFSDRRD